MATKNTAKNCIFILLTGAISTRDSWNLKVTPDIAASVVTRMNPTMINNVNWPVGIFPRLGQHLGDIALVRSMSSWALVHSLATVTIGKDGKVVGCSPTSDWPTSALLTQFRSVANE